MGEDVAVPLWKLKLYETIVWVQTINVFVLLAVLTWVLLR